MTTWPGLKKEQFERKENKGWQLSGQASGSMSASGIDFDPKREAANTKKKPQNTKHKQQATRHKHKHKPQNTKHKHKPQKREAVCRPVDKHQKPDSCQFNITIISTAERRSKKGCQHITPHVTPHVTPILPPATPPHSIIFDILKVPARGPEGVWGRFVILFWIKFWIEYFRQHVEWIIYWMNIFDLILNWISFWPDSA